MPSIRDRLNQGVWGSWVLTCELKYQDLTDSLAKPPLEPSSEIAKALLAYCDFYLPEEQAGHYCGQIRLLGFLEKCASTEEAANGLTWFITRAPQQYISAVRNGEHFSLLLLLYWYQLCTRKGQWWRVQAARLDGSILYMHLYNTIHDAQLQEVLVLMYTAW